MNMVWSPTPRYLGQLVAETEGAGLVRGDPGLVVRGIAFDSRRVEPGDLFVAVPGLERDGLEFVPDAIAHGAIAIAAEQDSEAPIPFVRVASARRALGDLAAAFFGHPSRKLPVVG